MSLEIMYYIALTIPSVILIHSNLIIGFIFKTKTDKSRLGELGGDLRKT